MWRGVSDAKSRASVRTRHSLRLIYCYISRRDAKYRMSINSFSDYKHLLQENFTLHLRRVSAVDNFPTRRRTSTLGFTCFVGFWMQHFQTGGFGKDGPIPWPPRSLDITRPWLLFMSCVYCDICNIRFLDATFPNRWIGRDGPTAWPPRSPDITPLHFFLYHVFIVTFVTFGFLMQHFQTGGLGEAVRQPGHHDYRISHPLTSFYVMCLL